MFKTLGVDRPYSFMNRSQCELDKARNILITIHAETLRRDGQPVDHAPMPDRAPMCTRG